VSDVYIIAALFLTFDIIRANARIWLVVGAVGVAVGVIAPRAEVRRVYINIPLVLLVGWLITTVAWTPDFIHFRDEALWLVPITAGAVVVGSVVPTERIARTLRIGMAAGIVMQYLALVLNPTQATTSTAGDTSEVVHGWDGTFGHKNGLAVFVIFTFITFLVLSPPSRLRTGVLVGCLPLIAGSQSSTGLSCFLVVLVVAAAQMLVRPENVRSLP
jgi:hypothetical protein